MKNFNKIQDPDIFRPREVVDIVIAQIPIEVVNKLPEVLSKLVVEAVSRYEVINATDLKRNYAQSAMDMSVLEEACDIASNPDIINALENTSSDLPMMAIIFLSNNVRHRKYSVRGLVTGITAVLVRSSTIGADGQVPPDILQRYSDAMRSFVY